MSALLVAITACGHAGSPSSIGPPSRASQKETRGHLLMVGGGPSSVEVDRRFVELAGGPGRARIAVFPMASELATTGPAKVNDLRVIGADAFVIDVKRPNADSDSIARKLDAATGIWFSGGDQSRLTAALLGSRIEKAIHARHMAGATVGGTSAGAAVMGETMPTGAERRPGGSLPLTDSSQAFITIDRDNVVTAPGFGLLPGAIVDQHFVRRRRHNRLVSLVLEHPSKLGVGIDESTAIDVHPDGSWEVIGAGVVVILDARRSKVTPPGSVLAASDVRMHILSAGSRFNPATGRVTRLGDRRTTQ